MRNDWQFVAMVAAMLASGTSTSPQEAVDRALLLIAEAQAKAPDREND